MMHKLNETTSAMQESVEGKSEAFMRAVARVINLYSCVANEHQLTCSISLKLIQGCKCGLGVVELQTVSLKP